MDEIAPGSGPGRTRPFGLPGHPDGTVENFVKVRVHNRGTVDAQDVVVRWRLKSPGVAGSDADFV